MAQVTKAMELVSASKMRKAQTQALSGRSYNQLMDAIIEPIKGSLREHHHPLLQPNGSDHKLIILLSTNRGLAGSLNSNLFRNIIINPEVEVDYVAVGKKATQFLARIQKNLLASFELPDKITFSFARTLKRLVLDYFNKKEYGEISIRYAHFQSTLRQTPRERLILPISTIELEQTLEGAKTNKTIEHKLEPDQRHILDAFLPHYLDMEIYQVLLEAEASEHSARMVAMKNATDNANDLVGDLTLTYNGERQAAITTEILDIATASMTMN